MPKIDKMQKIADYFGVTVDYLLTGTSKQKENAPTTQDGRDINDDDIKFALFGGDGEITDELYEEVKSFADFIKKREKDKRG